MGTKLPVRSARPGPIRAISTLVHLMNGNRAIVSKGLLAEELDHRYESYFCIIGFAPCIALGTNLVLENSSYLDSYNCAVDYSRFCMRSRKFQV